MLTYCGYCGIFFGLMADYGWSIWLTWLFSMHA
uniref:Uncharacterized protein n=1 Tax=Rhizophora mucronata TaxID=61149 RepID=A0A2P2QCG3_RHIMU